jgi:hypothetical protein
MTPEERFDHIEKLLQSTNEQLAAFSREFEQRFREFEQRSRESEQRFSARERETDKHNAAIQSLIVVARTCLDSIKEDRTRHERDYEEMRAQSRATEEKLNILVETVDRIIRHRNRE